MRCCLMLLPAALGGCTLTLPLLRPRSLGLGRKPLVHTCTFGKAEWIWKLVPSTLNHFCVSDSKLSGAQDAFFGWRGQRWRCLSRPAPADAIAEIDVRCLHGKIR